MNKKIENYIGECCITAQNSNKDMYEYLDECFLDNPQFEKVFIGFVKHNDERGISLEELLEITAKDNFGDRLKKLKLPTNLSWRIGKTQGVGNAKRGSFELHQVLFCKRRSFKVWKR